MVDRQRLLERIAALPEGKLEDLARYLDALLTPDDAYAQAEAQARAHLAKGYALHLADQPANRETLHDRRVL
jgi:hypothetical protein